MATLTKEQEQGAAVAAGVSEKASARAATLPEASDRLEAYAAQAETYLRTIDLLGIPRDHPRVADYARMSEKNIIRWENYTQGRPVDEPVQVPYDVRFAPKNCPMPDCDYVGAPGSCPTHGQT
jgi:hypothetical protein